MRAQLIHMSGLRLGQLLLLRPKPKMAPGPWVRELVDSSGWWWQGRPMETQHQTGAALGLPSGDETRLWGWDAPAREMSDGLLQGRAWRVLPWCPGPCAWEGCIQLPGRSAVPSCTAGAAGAQTPRFSRSPSPQPTQEPKLSLTCHGARLPPEGATNHRSTAGPGVGVCGCPALRSKLAGQVPRPRPRSPAPGNPPGSHRGHRSLHCPCLAPVNRPSDRPRRQSCSWREGCSPYTWGPHGVTGESPLRHMCGSACLPCCSADTGTEEGPELGCLASSAELLECSGMFQGTDRLPPQLP